MTARLRNAKTRDGERGASAVEFALVASLLLLVLFGIIQFGIAYNRVQGLNSSGREGARAASIGATRDEVLTRVQTAQSLFQQSDVTVDMDYSNDNGATWISICTTCSGSTSSCLSPCVVGSLIRVTAKVAKSQKYAIAIPLWANWQIAYQGIGAFRVEKTS